MVQGAERAAALLRAEEEVELTQQEKRRLEAAAEHAREAEAQEAEEAAREAEAAEETMGLKGRETQARSRLEP